MSNTLLPVGYLSFRNPPPAGPAPKVGGAKAGNDKAKDKDN